MPVIPPSGEAIYIERVILSVDVTTSTHYDQSEGTITAIFNDSINELLAEATVSAKITRYYRTSGGIENEVGSTTYTFDFSTETQTIQGWGTLKLSLNDNNFVSGTKRIAVTGNYTSNTYNTYSATANVNISEEKIVSIDTTDKYKNLDYGNTNSLSNLTIVYQKSGSKSLTSSSDISSYLQSYSTTVNCGSNSLSYPSNFSMSGQLLKNEAIQVFYNLSNGLSFSQYLAVRYIGKLVLTYSTSETGTVDNPIMSDADGITIGKTQFSASTTLYNNSFSNGVFSSTPSVLNVTSMVTWSKDYFSLQDISDLNGNPYNILITYNHHLGFNQTQTALLTVFLDIKRPVSAVINGSDPSVNYFVGEDSYFVEPSFTKDSQAAELISFFYSDGSTKDIELTDISSIEYMLTNDGTGTALVDGVSIVPPSATQLYAFISLTNGESAFAPFAINRKADTVQTVSCSPNFIFVLGNTLNKYKGNEIQVTAHWENTAKADTTNFVDFTFDYTQIVMTDSDLGVSTNIHIGSSQFSISLANVTYSRPAVSEVSFVNSTGIKTAYQNDIDAIDMSLVRLLVKYEGAEYTNELSFNSGNVAGNDEFGVKVYDSTSSQYVLINVNDINGTNKISFSDQTAIYNCKFEFQIKNEFTTNTATELGTEFFVTTIQKLTGIRIMKTYRDYKVGEAFLNENDDTVVRLFYDAVDLEEHTYTDSKDVLLRDDMPTLSINYAKGTEWTQPDSSKRIVVSSVFDNSINAEYTIEVTYDGFVNGSKTSDFVVVWKPYVYLPDGTIFGGADEPNGVLVLFDEEDTVVENGIRSLKPEIETLFNSGNTSHTRGYIRNIFSTKTLDAQATMVLFKDYTPPIEGSANITINFPSYSGLADNINKCQFGILFGNNNANNRLFVSGNPNVRNADWHSAETNTVHTEGEVQNSNGDFSYFPNENIMYYGETDNKVIGYDIVSNDKLLVLKDKSDKEKTVYFRTPTLVTALDATGATVTDVQGNSLYQEEFSLVKGNNSVAGINPHAIANLNGDTLFIDSDNTVQGLDLTGIVGDNQRYANTRSAYLDNFLKGLDLSESFLWTNNKYLFMPVKDEGLFVTHINAFGGESRQYEWWKLQSENPTCFAEIDNVIYFGNANGDLYRMRNGQYRDEYKVFVSEGDGLVSINEDEEKVTVSQEVFSKMFPDGKIDENRHLYFHSVNNSTSYRGSIFQQIGTINNDATADNVDLLIEEEDEVYYLKVVGKVNGEYSLERQRRLINLLKENQDYYLNYYKEEGIQEVKCNPSSLFYRNYYNRFHLEYVGGSEFDKYLLKIWNNQTQSWEDIDLADLYKATLVQMLDGDYELTNIVANDCSFQLLDENGQLMNIVYYADQPTSIPLFGEIIERRNVVAYYITAPFTMGSINYFKTIWSFTLTNDTGKPSEYDLAIASNKIPVINTKTIASVSKAKIGTNFNDFLFEAVDFDKDVVPRTYTIQRTLGMQKFVCFAFKNDNNSNAILSSMSVIYTLPFPSYGSD